MSHENNTLSRVERKRLEKRQLILARATDLLVREGLEAVTVHRLARELDLTVGALYRYFESKDALIASLTEEVIAEYGQALTLKREALDAQAQNAGDPLDALATLVGFSGVYFEVSMSMPARYQLVSRMLTDPQIWLSTERRNPVMTSLFSIMDLFERLIESAVAEGRLAPGSARQRTVLLWGGLTGVLSMQKLASLNPEQIPVAGLTRAMTETLFRGWGADLTRYESLLQATFSHSTDNEASS